MDEIVRLPKVFAERLLERIRYLDDTGPEGCSWQSDELQADIREFEQYIIKNETNPEKPMEAYQERVVEEKKELDIKLAALKEFTLFRVTFQKLSSEEQERLCRQQNAMEDYSEILGERIVNFT